MLASSSHGNCKSRTRLLPPREVRISVRLDVPFNVILRRHVWRSARSILQEGRVEVTHPRDRIRLSLIRLHAGIPACSRPGSSWGRSCGPNQLFGSCQTGVSIVLLYACKNAATYRVQVNDLKSAPIMF